MGRSGYCDFLLPALANISSVSGGALTVANRFKLAGDSLEQALWHMLDDVQSLGGDGGVIAVSSTGEIAMAF